MKNGIFITIFGLIEPLMTPTDEIIHDITDEQNEETTTEKNKS
jgi:hypothetical protein